MYRRYISPQQEHPVFDKKRFWIGVSEGVTSAIIMYLFLQVIRSAIFFVFGLNQSEILLIDFSEYRFYSFILAFFSIMFGGYQFLEFTFFKNRSFFKSGFQQKVILGNLRYVIWTTLFISFKLLLTCFLTLLIGTVSVWKFYAIGWWISILLSFFLYFYLWNNLKKIIPNTLKISLLCFPITLGLAFGLSQIKPLDMEYYQEFGLKRSIHYSKQIDVPEATDLRRGIRKSRVINFYIAHESNHPDNVKYYINHAEIQLEDIQSIVENFKRTRPEYVRNLLVGNVVIDKHVKMKNVYPLLERIRFSGINQIGLVGIQKSDTERKRYFNSFPHHLLIRLSLQNQALIDLVEHIKKNPNAPKTTWQKYLDNSIFLYSRNAKELETFFGNYLFDRKKVNAKDLFHSLTMKMQNKNDQLVSFYIDAHPDAPYESYFHIQHEFRKAKYEIRNNIAQEEFSKPIEYLSYEQQKKIRAITPFSIHAAYNADEKFLYDFFKKK